MTRIKDDIKSKLQAELGRFLIDFLSLHAIMSNVVALRKQLKIKTGVVTRLGKEVAMYRKEVGQLEDKRVQLIKDGHPEDEWDVKNTVRMKQESEKMIFDTTTRLDGAVEDLKGLIEQGKKETELAEDEDLKKAEQAIQGVAGL
ncbi:hypothetical protein BJ165DRAFT_1429638 [Panaeolus papilionaceus]|nr:hypothetical protein BJ165DRAFT_1429638 [Panaeolus papilionaceus]